MVQTIARQVVRDSLRLRERDRLWIAAWKHNYDLAEQIGQEAQSLGASVVLSVFSDSLLSHVLKEGPQEAVETVPDHWLQGVAKSTALVVLEGPEDPGILRSADKGKALGVMGQLTGILGNAVSHEVRTVHVLSSGVTERAAKVYGVDFAKWTEATNQCLSAKQASMLDVAQRIAKLLHAHDAIHISTSDGTDMRFRIDTSSILIDDGIIDEEDLHNHRYLAHLPAGLVSVPVDESSAEGTVSLDLPRAFLGDIVRDLHLEFRKGAVTAYRALRGEATFAHALRAGTGGKNRLSRLSFGVNPHATVAPGQPTDALMPGTVTLGLGDNTSLGGRNRSSLVYEHTLRNGIVSIGPNAVIMDGKLTI
jgi:leucyl aminopeptidase (aminopeptidase T)